MGEDVFLPDVFVEGARAHPFGERRLGWRGLCGCLGGIVGGKEVGHPGGKDCAWGCGSHLFFGGGGEVRGDGLDFVRVSSALPVGGWLG